MKLSMGILLAIMSVSCASDFSKFNQVGFSSFSGNYAKKQNKLSQSAKRKRARQKGSKK